MFLSRQSRLTIGKPRPFAACRNTATARSFQVSFALLLRLTVLSEADEPMMPAEVGERIGMTAEYAGPLLSRMLVRKLVEKPDKKTNRYQITQKGQEFLVKPPPPETIIGKKPETKAETKVEAKVENKVKEIPKEVPKEIPKEIPSQPPSKTRRAYSLNCRPKHAGRIP